MRDARANPAPAGRIEERCIEVQAQRRMRVAPVMSDWRERDADKQVRARRINEWTEHELTDDLGSLRCECRDPECGSVLTVTRRAYHAVRAHSTRFIVAPNHENPESERIVEEHERYAVIEAVTGEDAKAARRSYDR